MANGSVKFFNVERGYGFISQVGGEDVFVHATALEASGISQLSPGQRLEYTVERDGSGRTRAVDLKLIC